MEVMLHAQIFVVMFPIQLVLYQLIQQFASVLQVINILLQVLLLVLPIVGMDMLIIWQLVHVNLYVEMAKWLEHNVTMPTILMVMDAILIVLLVITIAVQLQLLISTLIQETALRLAPMVIILTQQHLDAKYANIHVQLAQTQLLVIVAQLVVIEF